MKVSTIFCFVVASLSAALAHPSKHLDTRAANSTVKGFDVSGHQPNVNFQAAYSGGLRFVLIKATESTNFVSKSFSKQYTDSINAGFIRGAYHFARPGSSTGAAQAEYFLQNGGKWTNDGKTLPGMLDLEVSKCDGLSTDEMVEWIQSFVATYFSATQRYPILYFSSSWWTQCTGNSNEFAQQCPLQLASWNKNIGTIPGGWASQTIWQNADTNPYGGDSDVFNGDMAALQQFASG